MLFNVAIFTSLLLAPVVLAVPSGLGTRIARRRESFYPGTLANNLERATDADSTGNPAYSSYLAGAVLTEGNGTFNIITGTFTVPTVSGSNGTGAAAWISIGASYDSAILQTGIVMYIESDVPTYYAMYKWYPAEAEVLTGLSILAGDVVGLTITTPSPTNGTIMIKNLNNGQIASRILSSSVPIYGQNAMWAVEDFGANVNGSNTLVPPADFGAITFTEAVAYGEYWTSYTPEGAAIVDMKQNNTVLTNVSTSEDTVTIEYMPPSN